MDERLGEMQEKHILLAYRTAPLGAYEQGGFHYEILYNNRKRKYL